MLIVRDNFEPNVSINTRFSEERYALSNGRTDVWMDGRDNVF